MAPTIQQGQKNKKSPRPLRSYLTNNMVLKILALVFAVILWNFVITETNPARTKNITEITVTASGADELASRGLIPRDDLTANPITVTVKVSVAHSDYKFINENAISASIDLTKVTKEGANSLPVIISFNNIGDVSLVSVTPASVNLTIDKLVSRDVPVSIRTAGELAPNLISLHPEYPETVSITGAAYYVDRIASAVVDVDLASLNDGDIVSSICHFEDESGNTIRFNGIRITADMDIQTVKEVPVSLENAVENTDLLAKGYQFNGITAEKVRICGHKDAVERISSVSPVPVDLTGKDAAFTEAPLTFNLPEGISLVPGQEPTAQIDIIEAQQSVTVERSITVSGLTPGLTASISNGSVTRRITADGVINLTATVTLTGPASSLNDLTQNDVIVRLSLLQKEAGTYDLQPVIVLSSALGTEITAQLISPSQLSVTIR